MSEDIGLEVTGTRPGAGETAQRTLLAGGGVLGAVAMTSCCIMPLAAFSLGATGAWIGTLAALYPYKLYFFVPAVGFLAGGFYKAYGKPAASVLVLAALAFPYVAPAFLET